MNETITRLLACKNLGMILFDAHFTIVETDNIGKRILKATAPSFSGKDLFEIFPEFIGNEQLIQEVVDRKTADFGLDYVNRSDADGQVYFLHLLVLPDEKPGYGLLVLEDVTDRARILQEVNQQKYELLLYKGSAGFRKRSLREAFWGKSTAVRQVRNTIGKLSKVPNATVLLLGESGTGKNLVARIIHYSSLSPDAPFVDINCAALPENLLESELFGYEKGAFTHATVSRTGLLQEAEGGTILLDEIGELPLNLQAKLLSFLETKRFRRLGGNKSIEVKARIIAATNRNLEKEVAKKRFRQDLYYRLNVVSLTLPPLCDLSEDILSIADHFLQIYNMEFKKQVKGFTEVARQALLNYSWPGNVRELSNCLERTMIFIEKEWIDAEDLVICHMEHTQNAREWSVPQTGISLEEVERQLIVSALKQAGGNKSKAARLLTLTRDTLRYRLEKYQLI
ncbi:MAG: sigma 54-interacting transcriptional regulator [Desulfobulbaceae bacterium]|nr:sigma 54-interacting transcriptional regulator [Desulfobulbaceae bacterium]